jgi:Uncharacterized small protein
MAELDLSKIYKVESISNEDFKKLLNLMESVRYGSITLIIQDGKVVQIDKNEKLRLK